MPINASTAQDSALQTLYQTAILKGDLLADEHQAMLIDALAPIYDELTTRSHLSTRQEKKSSFFSRFLSLVSQDEAEKPALIRGLYIWGGVGRGKTFIVDFFYQHLPIEKKQRTHFHSFMKSVHDQIRALGNIEDPLRTVAKNIATKTRVLCLDEMHVNDITDAMLLGGLFKYLFEDGVTLITTSNIEPAGLYKDGLQRKRFLPAIALLEQHTRIINSDGDMDYRMRALETANVYQIGTGEAVHNALQQYFSDMIGKDAEIVYDPVKINGRDIPVKQRCKAIAWFGFEELCVNARSTLDYIELATQFSTILISDIPVMSSMQDDAARRFVNLIDEFYDRGVNVVVSAHAAPDALYTGKRLAFEFQRTVSRLMEMRSKEYLFSKHELH
ncbi:MAG: cell division protein ZapE [Leucothrix sp.]